MNATPEGEPRYYSQVTAAAMHVALGRQKGTIRRLRLIIGALDREAQRQAETIVELWEEVERWRSLYMSAATENRHEH